MYGFRFGFFFLYMVSRMVSVIFVAGLDKNKKMLVLKTTAGPEKYSVIYIHSSLSVDSLKAKEKRTYCVSI